MAIFPIDPRVAHIAKQVTEAFGDYVFTGLSDAAERKLERIWQQHNCTQQDKEAVFWALYGPEALKETEAAETITVAEIQFMMHHLNMTKMTIYA